MYMYIPSLFILLSNAFIISSDSSHLPAELPKWQKAKMKAYNYSHIRAYCKKERKKKITHPKEHKHLDF